MDLIVASKCTANQYREITCIFSKFTKNSAVTKGSDYALKTLKKFRYEI